MAFVVVVVLDQVTKSWAVASLSGQPSLRVLGDFLMFTLVYNEGGAMGTQLGPSVSYLVMAVVVLPFLMYYIYRNRNDLMYSLPLSLIAAGAVGNLIDRIRLGKVIDFVDADFFDIDLFGFHMDRFWVFNIADAAISCAIVFLLIVMLFFQEKQTPPEEPVDPTP
ncbi:MAG: signal peptidase II [bacterium]|nr:signal peptidase II [bacterium]